MNIPPLRNDWRDTARVPKLFFLHWGAALFPLILLVHFRVSTVVLLVIGWAAFGLLNKFGYTPGVMLRVIKLKLSGRRIRIWRGTGSRRYFN